MTETGLLVAQVAFLVLLFGFLAAVVRSSARQLGRVQPPPIIAAGPVVDPPRRPEPAMAAAVSVAEPAPASPPSPEAPQNTLEPFPSPFASLDAAEAPTVLPGGPLGPETDVVGAHVPAAGDPLPDTPGVDTASEDEGRAAPEGDAGVVPAAEESTPFDILTSATQVSGPVMDLTAGITPRLIVETSPSLEEGSDLVLEGGLTIGRSGAADLSLADQYVSHMHARIMRRGPYYFVEDLGSTNGTFLNDLRVESSAQLKVRDTLRMGQTTLRYEE